jgi:hypothetical protein
MQTTTHNNLSEALRAALAAHPHEVSDPLRDQIEHRASQLDQHRLGGGDADALADELTKADAPSKEAQQAYLESMRAA